MTDTLRRRQIAVVCHADGWFGISTWRSSCIASCVQRPGRDPLTEDPVVIRRNLPGWGSCWALCLHNQRTRVSHASMSVFYSAITSICFHKNVGMHAIECQRLLYLCSRGQPALPP